MFACRAAHATFPCAIRLALLLSLFVCLPPAPAGADWLITPFVGLKFGGETNPLVDLETAAGEKKLAVGGSVSLLGDGLLGLEADFGYSPRFFEREGGLVVRSYVWTLTGSVILAAPLGLTRESLRPYVVGGLGLIRARSEDLANVVGIDSNLLGLIVGGGAVGFVTSKVGLRFDIRRFSRLSREDPAAVALGPTPLNFWRASVGVVLRY